MSFNRIKCYLIGGVLAGHLLFPSILHAVDWFNISSINPTQQTIRDPFTPSILMFNSVGRQVGVTGYGSAGGFMRSLTDKVPEMQLRGFATSDKNTPIALLEVGGKTFLVHVGDEINVDPTKPLNVLRITKITRLSVTVETGRLGSIRVQR